MLALFSYIFLFTKIMESLGGQQDCVCQPEKQYSPSDDYADVGDAYAAGALPTPPSFQVVHGDATVAGDDSLSFTRGEDHPNARLCRELAAYCPYLRSPPITPSAGSPLDANTFYQVNVTFIFQRIARVDEARQSITIQGVLAFTWQMPPCAYNATIVNAVNASIQFCPFDKDSIWHPHVALMNAVGDQSSIETAGSPKVYVNTNDGTAFWSSQGSFESSCEMTVKNFPFDQQKCTAQFGSTYATLSTGDDQFVMHVNHADGVDDAALVANENLRHIGVWYMSNFTRRESSHQTNYFTYDVILQRNYQRYIMSIFVPSWLLTVLQLASLAMPAELPDRPQYGMTIVLAIMVLQGASTGELPQTSEVLYVVIYLASMTLLCVVINVYSLVTCHFARRYKKAFLHREIWRRRVIDWIDLFALIVYLAIGIILTVVFYHVIAAVDDI